MQRNHCAYFNTKLLLFYLVLVTDACRKCTTHFLHCTMPQFSHREPPVKSDCMKLFAQRNLLDYSIPPSPCDFSKISSEMGEVTSFSAAHSASTLCRNFVLHASGWFNFTSPLQLHSAALHAAFVSFQLSALAQCVPFFSLPLSLNNCTEDSYTLYRNWHNYSTPVDESLA